MHKLTRQRWFFPSSQGKRYDTDNFSSDLINANEKADLQWNFLDYGLLIVGESHYFWHQETPEEIAADYHANAF